MLCLKTSFLKMATSVVSARGVHSLLVLLLTAIILSQDGANGEYFCDLVLIGGNLPITDTTNNFVVCSPFSKV